jgi:CRP-like cAMP-binding protein
MANADALKLARRNRLLAALPPREAEGLLLRLRYVMLPNERVLLSPEQAVEYAYFPLEGVIALLIVMEDGTPVEVGTVGSEGFVSIESILSTNYSPHELSCQTEVEALRADVADLRAAFRASEALRDVPCATPRSSSAVRAARWPAN